MMMDEQEREEQKGHFFLLRRRHVNIIQILTNVFYSLNNCS